ncbi:MAG: aconitate hydratase [Clostridia bacterium]|nr:aconitate hydratase [Clostridia bacterium]
MRGTMTAAILAAHRVAGDLRPGASLLLRVDQVLVQDVFGPQIFAELEEAGLSRARVPLVATYCDHMVYQFAAEHADDHRYLRDAARRLGSWYAAPGTGVCHQVHAERFGRPGTVLVGSDSHTVQGGGLGAFATGTGGQEVELALMGGGFRLAAPAVVQVRLTGELGPWVTAKDVALELLRRLSARGGLGRVFEYAGAGLRDLSAQERMTIANMSVELSATGAIFPSDETTRAFLMAHGRGDAFRPLAPEADAEYEDEIALDLSEIEPLVARPGRTDDVVPAGEASEGGGAPVAVDQVLVGSCTNGSFADLVAFAEAFLALGGRVAPGVDCVIAPSSQAGLACFLATGLAEPLLRGGVRISESTCGACLGVGHVPAPGSVSVRTFNRNFRGRSGLSGDRVYLASPVVAAAAAVAGRIVDPRRLAPSGARPPRRGVLPTAWPASWPGLHPPAGPEEAARLAPRRPEGLAVTPGLTPLPDPLVVSIVAHLPDDVSTDDIQPARTLGLWRSDPVAAARTILAGLVPDLARRCDEARQAAGAAGLVAGANYGQGSSREQAALGQRLLGVRLVVARSFARIHRRNLVNFGVLPASPASAEDEAALREGAVLRIPDLARQLAAGDGPTTVVGREGTRGREVRLRVDLDREERAVVLAGGLKNHVRDHPVQAGPDTGGAGA